MAYISLGYKCNHKCIICPNKNADATIETPQEQIFKMLDNLKNSGTDVVTISGGEPSLHKSFLETIHYATKLGIKTNVLSNGDSLNDMNFVSEIEKAVDKNLFSITTAFHSCIWQDRSRSESWTPEMKEKARQKSLERRAKS